MRLAIALSAAFGLVAAAPVAWAGHSFVIPANDGYGLEECLANGAPCGRLVADAWCDAQGLGKATSFGPVAATDVTGSVTVSPASAASQSYAVTCRD